MDIWKSLDGMVEAELTSAEPGAALEAANARGIPLYDVIQVGDLTARFRVRRRDYRTLEALSEKRGETLHLRRRMGAYWTLKRLLARPMLLCGLAVFLAAAIFLPTRIFFVRVEGNVNTPTRLILDAAGESGIRFGASRRAVRSEKMKNALLSALPQLQWAGVNTSGCVATVSVRERTDPEVTEQDFGGEQHCGLPGRLHRLRHGDPGQFFVSRGAVSEGGAGADLRVHRLRYLHSGDEGGGGDLCPDKPRFCRRDSRSVDGSGGADCRQAKIQPYHRKKTYKFMERQWNFAGQL